jgi:hypothetical protein
MFDWAKKLFAEPQTLTIILTSGIIGLITGIAQGIVQKRHGGWGGFISAILTGIVVSVIVGLAIQGFVSSETLRLAIVGACAVVSEDIWNGLKTLGAGLRADPLGFVVRVLDAIRGRAPSDRAKTTGNTVTTIAAPLDGQEGGKP